MADISALGVLAPIELDLEDGQYADSKGFTLPPAGEYTLQAPSEFPSSAFGKTQEGNLSIQIDPKVVGSEHDGFQVKFARVSAKQFLRDGKKASQAGDYLRAAGVKTRITSMDDLVTAVEGTANRTYKAYLDWRAYNKNNGFSVEGMTRFTPDGKGGYLPFIADSTDVDPETGQARRLRAQIFIRRFVPAEA